MAGSCTVCTNSSLQAINLALGTGTPAAEVAREYGIGVDSLKRHRANHLSPAAVKVAIDHANQGSAYEIEAQILATIEDLRGDFLEFARDRKSARGGTEVHTTILRALELLARLSGQLDERPSITVNVLQSSEIQELLGDILRALEPYQEARLSVAAALRGREVVDVALEAAQ